ncbi:MAG: peptide chain release factor N(5)-glutamine methyltransferase [Coriobacteriales bacterium]|jgi:release factor glutamine methyltransferase
MGDTWTVARTLDWCKGYLERHDDEHPRLSAEILLAAATGLSRVELYAYFDRPLSAEERATLRESLKRRGAGEPLQYVTGDAAFRHIVVKTARGVLIPRPETESLVELVLSEFAEHDGEVQALEVGCGTGCIACSLAKEAGMHVTATDISPEALTCAKGNVEMLGLTDNVDVVEADCVEGVEGPFDVLVSNPPYIPTAVLSELPQEVVGFEPKLALDGGIDGLVFFDRLVAEAVPLLTSGGFFACELHEDCLDEAATRLERAGLHDVAVHEDLTGRSRFVTAHTA